jgi:hypothetical protein
MSPPDIQSRTLAGGLVPDTPLVRWTDELQWHTGATVRLESGDDFLADEVRSRSVIVADLAWRDPSTLI